jgi:xanthine dehydrogenase accessory factor
MKTVLILLKKQQSSLGNISTLLPIAKGGGQSFSKYTFVENVIPALLSWQRKGLQTTLITLVDREGSSPRPIGAQMATNERGEAVGHIATDCLHDALILEAKLVMSSKQNKLIRYGKGSPYIDLKLPCGSGLDLYFDQSIELNQLETMTELASKRKAFTLTINMSEGITTVSTLKKGQSNERSTSDNMIMFRNHFPPLQLLIAGNGPAVMSMANIAKDVEFKTKICTTEDDLLKAAMLEGYKTLTTDELTKKSDPFIDEFTAVVLLFHDHEKELPLYKQLLENSPFYIGAMGSKKTHQQRIETLKSLGIKEEEIAKIKGPIGIVPIAKNPSLLALSVISEIMNEAQSKGYIC